MNTFQSYKYINIPEDRPRGICILVSLTSLMSSSDHLRGVLSASWNGCFSRAWLQLHHRTVEIHTGYWSMQYLVKDPRCHLTLAHWWVYSRDLNRFMSLVIFGLRWRQCSEAPTMLLYKFMIDATYLYHRDSDSPLMSPYSYVSSQIQYAISHEDIAFYQNSMGSMYHFFRSVLYSASH